MSLFDQLTSEMQNEHRKWALDTKLYGTINPIVRAFLIVVSAIVASQGPLGPDRVR